MITIRNFEAQDSVILQQYKYKNKSIEEINDMLYPDRKLSLGEFLPYRGRFKTLREL